MLVVASAEWIQNELLHLVPVWMRKDCLFSLIHLPFIPMIHNRYIPSTFNLFRNPATLITLPQAPDKYPNLLSRLFGPNLLNQLSHIILTRRINKPEPPRKIRVLVQKVVPVHAVTIDDDVRSAVEVVDFDDFDGGEPVGD